MTGLVTSNNNGHRKMVLLDFQLPVRDSDQIKSLLKANDLPFLIPEAPLGGSYYNCWGYVAINFGWDNQARWLDRESMEEYLQQHTKPIKKTEATIGDIIVFRGYAGRLEHTALATCDPEVVCHKPGNTPLCMDTLENAKYTYGGHISYVRPLGEKSLLTSAKE